MSRKKYIYFFGNKQAEGKKEMRDILGGKGANLAEMVNLGIPVPPGFTITTEACNLFYENKMILSEELKQEIKKNIKKVEVLSGLKFGDSQNPLLFSVRSGAKFSMPGMMDTILNLGLNDEIAETLAKKNKNKRFVYDSHRRLIQMFGNVVLGIKKDIFEDVITEIKRNLGIELDTELDSDILVNIISKFKKIIQKETKINFPTNPYIQLYMAIEAVFKSWNVPRAVTYRNLHNIPHNLGTAVNVQMMVFGNMGETSGTGVVFTRNPSIGTKEIYGEFLMNAQGEDVVAGNRTPLKIEKLKDILPSAYNKLLTIVKKAEKHYREMQDMEFTIEDKKLYVLQTRTGKRTAQAAVKIAVDMVKEGLLTKKEALLKIDALQLTQLLHPIIDPDEKLNVIATGLAASPGAVSGEVVFTADEAEEEGKSKSVILVRKETCPDDIHGMIQAKGILTSRGGMTSHAAVVARGLGKCCVVGCETIQVNEKEKYFTVNNIKIKKGEIISLEGTTGKVILGKVKVTEPSLTNEFNELMSWADKIRRLKIRANADYPKDAKIACLYGAEGIGLCRTEHMFFEEDRLPIVREMILAESEVKRKEALEKLLPIQRKDFEDLFKEMNGLPITIRLIDPPLHEFLPNKDVLLTEITKLKAEKNEESQKILQEKEKLYKKVLALHEVNPMLGHRGCRLGITYPEIIEMQTKAIFEAIVKVSKEGYKVFPEIMIPVVSIANEVSFTKEIIIKTAEEILKKNKLKIKYSIGTMIELPRAAIIADQIAKDAEFFSFGTNDLTQTVFGFSRDDAEGKFISEYINKEILLSNPFEILDQTGVGELILMAVKRGRKTRPNLKIGLCGEHGGDPSSIDFCHRAKLDYVSCSPYRIPIARLSAAQSTIRKDFSKKKLKK